MDRESLFSKGTNELSEYNMFELTTAIEKRELNVEQYQINEDTYKEVLDQRFDDGSRRIFSNRAEEKGFREIPLKEISATELQFMDTIAKG